MKIFITFACCLFGYSIYGSTNLQAMKKGRWVGYLQLTPSDKLHFEFELDTKSTNYSIILRNGKEEVPLNTPELIGDSIHVKFSNFNTELIFKRIDSKTIKGRWVNHLKSNYSIPFEAKASKATIFPIDKNTDAADFSGKWKAAFSPSNNPYDAIGLFEQKGHSITGSFLTETGDFRFLSGNTDGNRLYLSGFDGSHAFLFKGTQTNGEIKGTYFSGSHYQTDWSAVRNENFELRPADSLTTVVGDPRDVVLKFNELDGSSFSYPNDTYANKVVIIQVLGTWCGNCMDETVYFKELYSKYHSKGLEIISVGYELGADFTDYSEHLLQYKNQFKLEHKILVGGSAKKSDAKNDFHFLSDFTSFPTSIFIDKSGKIVRVHTGFNGPSTGNYFKEYKEQTELLIERLIKE